MAFAFDAFECRSKITWNSRPTTQNFFFLQLVIELVILIQCSIALRTIRFSIYIIYIALYGAIKIY
jgi:hypothetical protein